MRSVHVIKNYNQMLLLWDQHLFQFAIVLIYSHSDQCNPKYKNYDNTTYGIKFVISFLKQIFFVYKLFIIEITIISNYLHMFGGAGCLLFLFVVILGARVPWKSFFVELNNNLWAFDISLKGNLKTKIGI